MRKLLLTLSAVAALAIPQLTQAQTEPFDFSGPTTSVSYGTYGAGGEITIAGTFFVSGTQLGPDGGYEISSITGTYADTESGVSGNITLYNQSPEWATYEQAATSQDGSWYYDNLYYANNGPNTTAPGTTNGEFDLQGLLFYVGPQSDPTEWEVNFWSVNSTTYQLEESVTGEGQHYLGGANDISITPANTFHQSGGGINSVVPEGSGWTMLGLGGLALAGVFLFKVGETRRQVNS